jgi:hypothetical protein
MFDKVISTLEKWVEPFKQFILDNSTNPLLWVGLFLGGVLIFFITYGALNKND